MHLRRFDNPFWKALRRCSPVVLDTDLAVRLVLLEQYYRMSIRNGRLGLLSFALLIFAMAYEAPLRPRVVAMLVFSALLLWREWLATRSLRKIAAGEHQSSILHDVLVMVGAAVWALPAFALKGHISEPQMFGILYSALIVVAVVSISYVSALPASILLIWCGVLPQALFLLTWGKPTALLMVVGIVVCGIALYVRVLSSHAQLLRALGAEHQNASLVAELERYKDVLQSENLTLGSSLREAHDDALHDPLTGLYNRRHLQSFAPPFRRMCAERQEDLGVCLGDLDFFKDINDRHGHPVGDGVLQRAAQLLSRRLREGDSLIRYGGEEFLVILRRCDIDRAFRVADTLRRSLAAADFSTPTGSISVTISFGVAQWGPDEDIGELIERVDLAMYEAKQSGRNRVVVSALDAPRLSAVRFDSTFSGSSL